MYYYGMGQVVLSNSMEPKPYAMQRHEHRHPSRVVGRRQCNEIEIEATSLVGAEVRTYALEQRQAIACRKTFCLIKHIQMQ